MGRRYVPSTPASRGEPEPDPVHEASEPLTPEQLEAAAADAGFTLVRVTEPAQPADLPDAKKTGVEEPAGNASREDWATFAVDVKGAKPEDLLDEDGKDLGRDALREKYGTPAS